MLFNFLVWGWFMVALLFVAAVALSGPDNDKRGRQLAVAMLWPLAFALYILIVLYEVATIPNSAPPKGPDSV